MTHRIFISSVQREFTKERVANLTVKGVEWNLKKLTESKRLRRVGPAKGGHWEVIG